MSGTPPALAVIRREHEAMSAVLQAIARLVAHRRADASAPDFGALRALLFYLDEFGGKRHHRIESELLFPRLRARAPLQRDLLDDLEEEHRLGEARIRELEHALLACEVMGGEVRRAAFETAVARYADFYAAHMRAEELDVLPLAQQLLSPADWDELGDAFASNHDALAGAAPQAEYAALFAHVIGLAGAR